MSCRQRAVGINLHGMHSLAVSHLHSKLLSDLQDHRMVDQL